MPSPARRVAQAIDALRHGWAITFENGPTILPIETAIASATQAGQILISSARAATLKLGNQINGTKPDTPVLIRASEPFTLAEAFTIADPALDLQNPLKGPYKAEHLKWQKEAETAMRLANLAGVLPAFLVEPSDAGEAVPLSSNDISDWVNFSNLFIATRAHLPIAADKTAEIIAFRSVNDTREHVALIVGKQSGDFVPLVRLHSECLTGDIMGSLKCDCGPQLDTALRAMAQEANTGGWGVLVYLRQEGRGIGLINKLRAYQLQDQGFDTVEANERLGLPNENRDFAVAAKMLKLLGTTKVRLLTNNPLKVNSLQEAGVEVSERIAHQLPSNKHNERYLSTKRDKSGHLLD